jgi:dihydroflavonol-4-reductase
MVAVTGATGHLGNVLVRELVSRNEAVRVVIPPGEDATSLEGLKIEKVEGSVLDINSLVGAFKGAEVVYHLAGILFTSPRRTRSLYEVNVAGTRNVVEACSRCGTRRLIYTSSIQAMVEPPKGTVFDERSPFDPDRVVGHYAKSKAEASLEVLSAVKKGLDAVILCPTGAIGPYDFKPSKMGKWFLDVAKDKIDGRIYTVGGIYDYVDVRDIAMAQIAAHQRGRSGEAYILSGERICQRDQTFMMQEVAGVHGRCYGIPVWQLWLMAGIGYVYNWIRDTTPGLTLDEARIVTSNSDICHDKASKELGFQPRPMRETVADTIEWFRQNGKLLSADYLA